MKPLAVLNIAGLTPSLLGRDTPRLNGIASGFRASVGPVLPAVTCSVQATYLTGLAPRDHGIVANGWYFRDLSEVLFWRQSARLLSGETAWAAGRKRDRGFTCAQLFWWFNQGSGAEISVTPKPWYGADGSKVFGIQSEPAGLAATLVSPAADRQAVRRLEDSIAALHKDSYLKTLRTMTLCADDPAFSGLPGFVDLGSIAVPTLVICGADDTVTPPDTSRAMARAIPNARLHIIPGAGHLTNIEKPDEFNTILLKFLRDVSAPRRQTADRRAAV